jgi:hypothetical protein
MAKISKLFHPFSTFFEFFTLNRKSGENVLGFPPGFQQKIDGKKQDFSPRIQQKNFEFSKQ